MVKTMTASNVNPADVAIVGMACRVPGARNIDEFWNNLRNSVESIKFFTDRELFAGGVPASVLNDPNYVKAAGVLPDADCFDAAFFGYSPREAELMDPQHRIFLECAWEGLEHAGYCGDTYNDSVAVFPGCTINTYILQNLIHRPDLLHMLGEQHVMIGNDKDYVASRVSYHLDLKGPSVTVQTACSSSLVAVHLACQSLLSG